MTYKHTSESIIQILNSITDLSVDDHGEIRAVFKSQSRYEVSYAEDFAPGSFTRELLEIISAYLTGVRSVDNVLISGQ